MKWFAALLVFFAFSVVSMSAAADEVAILKTQKGEIVIEFWPEVAPKTVENFKKLARSGFYNGTAFHRILPGFMVQGGDPLTKDPAKEALWGSGNPGYQIQGEFNARKHQRGVVSMARSGEDPDSAGSQFFLMFGDAPHLDGRYTGFGRIIKGEEVLAAIEKTPVELSRSGEPSKPTQRIEIQQIKIVPRSQLPKSHR